MKTIHFQDNIDLHVLYAKLEALIAKRHGYTYENITREQNGYSLAYSCDDFLDLSDQMLEIARQMNNIAIN